LEKSGIGKTANRSSAARGEKPQPHRARPAGKFPGPVGIRIRIGAAALPSLIRLYQGPSVFISGG
jgi:hypothetical protein